MFNIDSIIELLLRIPTILISLVVHEYCHSYASYKLGDPTAKSEGRLTLNPLKHLDVVGTLMLIFFRFGWAKPVPINPYYYKNRRLGTIIVSLAGPLSNFLLAFIGTVIFVQISKANPGFPMSDGYLHNFVTDFMFINVSLFIFNLMPIPPLDGSKVLVSLFPDRIAQYVYKYEFAGMLVLLALVYMGVLTPALTSAIEATLNGFVYVIGLIIPF